MKKNILLFLSAILLISALSGCRGKPNDNQTPSTTTAPTIMTTEMTEAAPQPDPTVASGNGPIDPTEAKNGITENAAGSESNASRSKNSSNK